ncbi:MAG TPA: MraY family glycosyltransferase [Bacteroidia bacterium]|jgi:UDP-GlcNAc:undecaprenyl-phosphate GlcNAc-1-phosphate transferase|nr:MraY family glycosyltransferase [Bacteroidia bacterium]
MALNLPLFYFSYFVFVFVLSILMNSLFLKFSRTLGIRKSENIIRWSDLHKPALGGITFFITFLLSLIIYSLFFASSNFLLHSETLGLLAGCTIAFLMGLADDAYDTNPILKFSAQVFCGIILIYSGIYIQLFENIYIDYLLTMLWVVGIMNAINLLDNMDAISSVVSLNVMVTILCLLIIEKHPDSVFFTLILGTASAISAFLLFNWYPSKMYMGDTGTQFLGVFMAAVSILFLWGTAPETPLPATKHVLSVLLTFALPIIDTTVVFTNRLLKGASPFVGGKDHTTHHLFYLGINEPRIALIYSVYSGISLLCVVFINKYIQNWSILYCSLFALYFVASLVAFFIITRKKKKDHAA